MYLSPNTPLILTIISNTFMMLFITLVCIELFHEIKERAIKIGRSTINTQWVMFVLGLYFVCTCLQNLVIMGNLLNN